MTADTIDAQNRPITVADLASASAALAVAIIEALNMRGSHRTETVQALANDLHDQATALPDRDVRKPLLSQLALAVMARE